MTAGSHIEQYLGVLLRTEYGFILGRKARQLHIGCKRMLTIGSYLHRILFLGDGNRLTIHFTIVPESGGFEVANNQYYNNIGKTDAPSAGGGSTGGGSGSETTYPAITVKSQYKLTEWGVNNNFNFTTTDGKIYTCKLDDVPSETKSIWFRIVRDGKEYGPQSTTDDLVLTGDFQRIYENTNKALEIKHTSGRTSYTITYDYVNNQIKYDAPESGGTTGGGGTGGTTVTNPLSGRVYSEGYYLVGNFFNFDGDTINYKDAVFKFKQQEDDKDGNAVYMLEIPATLTARAQVMSVDAAGNSGYYRDKTVEYGTVRERRQGTNAGCTGEICKCTWKTY